MAVTTGVNLASGTPATDLRGFIITKLVTDKGWTYIGSKTAATCGTTADVRFYASPNTTVASSIYTGCIVAVETDDANLRCRIRVMEKFDDSATGSPATNTKWAAPGNTGSQTVTANEAVDDSYLALFQSLGSGQKVGWVDITVNASGYFYLLGANDDCFFVATMSGGTVYGGVFCQLVGFLGDFGTGSGGASVLLLACNTSTTAGSGSWSPSTSIWGNGRMSRMPNVTGVSGTFQVATSGSFPFATSTDPFGHLGSTRHNFYRSYPLFPAYLHGTGSSTWDSGRALIAALPDLYVTPSNGSTTSTNCPAPGDEIEADGTAMTFVCPMHWSAGTTNVETRGALLWALSSGF